MTTVSKSTRYRRIPKGTSWLIQIFDKAICLEEDAVLFRKVTSVERQASEGLLIKIAGEYGFRVMRMGTHYIIYRPTVAMVFFDSPPVSSGEPELRC